MSTASEIKTAFERTVSLVTARPSIAKNANTVDCTIIDAATGTRCECVAGECRIRTDAGTGLGGEGDLPSPGFFARTAIGACVAIGYRVEFARRELPVAGITVRVHTESDARGVLGLDESLAGFRRVKLEVELVSDADPAALRDAMDCADRCSPVLQSIVRPTPVEREVDIKTSPQAAE